MGTGSATHVDTEENVLRVKSASNPQAVAAAVAHAIYDGRPPTLRAIGAGAVNQAVKALAIASGYCAQKGIHISVRPGFTTITVPNPTTQEPEEVSAILLIVVTS